MIFFSIYTLTRIIELLSLQCSFLDHVPFDYLLIIRVFVYFQQGTRIHGHKFYVYYQMVINKFLTFLEKNVPLSHYVKYQFDYEIFFMRTKDKIDI